MGLYINEQDIHISRNIRNLRKKMRWGMKTLAYKLNVSIQQIQKYETAANKISASMLYEISKIFEVPMARFFQEDEQLSCAQHSSAFNIVLIEDDLKDEVVIREAIEAFPEKTNLYSIQESGKAVEFLRTLHNTQCVGCIKPDIVLLELNLIKANGLDILKNIKKDRQLNCTPVVLLTDRTNISDMESSYNFHAGGLIVKSCSTEELRNQIHHLLSYWTQLVTLPKQHGQDINLQ